MNRKLVGSLMLVLMATTFPVYALEPGVLATVNGQPVKRSWLDVLKSDAAGKSGNFDEKAVSSRLVRNELLAQEAVRLGIDKRPDFIANDELRRRELLANKLIADTLKNSQISDEALKAEYENYKKALGDKEYSARHIQVASETEAKDLIAQLAKGVDFAKLAKEKSQDQRTRDNGGSLGWFAKNTITWPLGDAASKLQKGLFTTVPLRSRAGWHVLRLDDVRDLKPEPFDKVKNQLRTWIQAQQISKLVKGLESKAKIDVGK